MPWTNANTQEFERRVSAVNWHFEWIKNSSLHSLIALLKKNPPASAAQVRNALNGIPANKKDQKYRSAIDYLRVNFPGLDEVQVGGYTYKNFSGIHDEQNRLVRAQRGVGLCYDLVKNCQKAMTKVVPNTMTSASPGNWNQAQRKATELFQKWLDNSRAFTSVERVRQIFNNMENALRANNWEIVLYGTPEDPDPEGLGDVIANAFAFVVPAQNAYRIYLGALFWSEGEASIDAPTVSHGKISAPTEEQWREQKKTKTAMDAAIVTTLHELCHVRAISGATAITDVQPGPYNLATCKNRAQNRPDLALTNAENYAQFASALLMEKHFF